MKNILFRADSSSTIGTGHIMRDLVLAEQFEDDNIIFATQVLPGNINHQIKEKNYKIEILNSNDIGELDTLIKKLHIDMIVIDHYDIDHNFEEQLKTKNPKLKIFSLDDTYEKHYCDILLNHNIYADAKKYAALVPKGCELRCGEKYTLLRDEFMEAKERKRVLTDNGIKNIFIAMGGSDIVNLNPEILKVLKKFENVQVDMVTTTANQNLKELQQFIKDKPWVNLHINSNEIARLIAMSDLAIVTPSVTMNEVWYMKIPFIAIEVAENQVFMSEFLIAKHKDVLKVFNEQKVHDLVSNYLNSNVDLINFIHLSKEEKREVLKWRNDETVRKWMYNKELISLDDHFEYIDSLKSKEDRVYFLVKKNKTEIGVIDLTSVDNEDSSAEVGLYAKPGKKSAGKVLIKSIIDYGFNHLKLAKLYANVYKENQKALRLYEKFGFIEQRRDEKLIYMELKNENR